MMQFREPSLTVPVIPPICVIGSHYCRPYLMNLEISLGTSSNPFTVKDAANGNTLFSLSRPNPFSPRHRRVLVDGAGNPIITLCKKLPLPHGRWQVFMSESTDQQNLLFSVKRAVIFQRPRETELHVFRNLNNTEENHWDFNVKGNWFQGFCFDLATVQSPNNNIATLMGRQNRDNLIIARVETNVDYAFIVALIVILDEKNLL